MSILKHRELSSKIEALEAEISKLRKKEKLIMQKCGKTDHAGMEELQKQINERRAAIQHVDGRKPVIRENIHKGMHLYVNLINEFDDYDPYMLMQDRLKIRPDAEAQIRTEIAKKLIFQSRKLHLRKARPKRSKRLTNKKT